MGVMMSAYIMVTQSSGSGRNFVLALVSWSVCLLISMKD